jgi:integrase
VGAVRRQREAVRLTKRTVDAFVCPAGRKDAWLFDADLPGFALRATAQGAKVFHFQYRAGAKVQRVRLGEYGPLTSDQARKRAEVLLGQVTGGADPKAEREAARRAAAEAAAEVERRAAADALTFRVLVERWRDLHLASRREGYRSEAVRALLASFPTWHARPAHGIAAIEAVAELDHIASASGRGAARLAYAYGHAMYGWAVRRHMLVANPFAGIEAPARVRDRNRVLSDTEIGIVWRTAEGLGWPFGPFVRFLLLTLQRREEVAGMRWGELTPDLSAWTIPAERAKNGRARYLAQRAALRWLRAGVLHHHPHTHEGKFARQGAAAPRASVRLLRREGAS